MRNSLILLSSLALAATASAHDTTATATTTADFTLAANVHVMQLGLVQEPYHILGDGTDGNSSDDLGGTLVPGGSSSTSHAGDGVSTFSATATATATLDSPDYSAVHGAIGYGARFQGYRYYLTLKNLTTDDQTVSFHVRYSQTDSGSASSPYGLATFDTNGNATRAGAYAESDFFGGVIDKSTDDAYTFPNERSGFGATTIFGTSVAGPTYGSSGVFDEFDAIYTLPSLQIHTYEFYAVSEAYAEFVPVPEPSAFAVLGLGALGLLRRRRKQA